MVNALTSSVNFRSNQPQFNTQNTQQYIPEMYYDTYIPSAVDKNEAKRIKKQDRLNTMLAYSSVGIAVGLVGSLLLNIGLLIKSKNGDAAKNFAKNFKMDWTDFAKKEKFPKLSDDCVNPQVRDFIETMKARTGLSKEICNAAGTEMPEQCMIMWGPSGTGKTFSAKLLAKEIGAEYSEVEFSDVSSPLIGQTAVEIQTVFNNLIKKAQKEPNKKFLVAFNEIDALLVPREKCGSNNLHLAENRTAFLNGLDRIKSFNNIKIVGTTNVNPNSGNLDKASLRRFGNILEIKLPTKKEVISSLKFHLGNSENVQKLKFFEENEKEIDKFAQKLVDNKYAHGDIQDIAEKAKSRFGIAIKDTKNISSEKFDMKYLEEAFKNKGKTVGAIEEPIPIWQRMEGVPEFATPYPETNRSKVSWLQKILSFFKKKEA